MSTAISAKEAIKRVREGLHPSQVLFEGSDAAIIDPKKSSIFTEMLRDAILIARAGYGKMKGAYLSSGAKHEGLEKQINVLRQNLMTMESIAAAVKPDGTLNDEDPDMTDEKMQPDNYQGKGKTMESLLLEQDKEDEYAKDKKSYGDGDMDYEKEAENFDGEEEPASEMEPEAMEDENMGYAFNVKGVEDYESFMQAVQKLASDHGGILMTNGDENEDVAYENVNYQPVGKEYDVKSGKKPDDEEGNPKDEGGAAVKDVKSPDKTKTAVDYYEGYTRVRHLHVTEGLRHLMRIKSIIPAKVESTE